MLSVTAAYNFQSGVWIGATQLTQANLIIIDLISYYTRLYNADYFEQTQKPHFRHLRVVLDRRRNFILNINII